MLEQAEDAEKDAKADLVAAEEQLDTLGAKKDHPSSIVNVYAPISGVIVAQNVTNAAAADEGALWVRGTLAQSTGPDEAVRVANTARLILCSFPEVPDCTSQAGRPDDGTDHTGFYNTEYFVDLKPKEQWRPLFHKNTNDLIAAMTDQLEKKLPGVVWGFSQPIEDNMEEAVSGVKGELATKVYGSDLHTLEDKATQIAAIMSHVKGIADHHRHQFQRLVRGWLPGAFWCVRADRRHHA
jgi:cobalt-zinc-cadmium resistance protein CzcA